MASPPPKKKRKATRLVTAACTPAAKKIADANALQSPLLRLSPVLRNRIYREVFGGHYFHVEYCPATGNGKQVIICKANQDRAVDRQFICHKDSWSMLGVDGRPKSVDHQLSLDVALLQVCKQINNEAALLPFLLNSFSAKWLELLATFTDELIASQSSALMHLVLEIAGSYPYNWSRISKTDKARIAKLTGLKTVTILLELGAHGVISSHQLQLLLEALSGVGETLQWHSVTHVSIRMMRRGPHETTREDVAPSPAHTAWIGEAENKLLAAWSQ